MSMEITGSSPALIMMSKQLHAAQAAVASTQGAPATPQNNVDVILQLSSAAQQLMTSR